MSTIVRAVRALISARSREFPTWCGGIFIVLFACALEIGCGKTLTGIPDPGPPPQPRPSLASVSPQVVLKGTTGLVLTLTGTNFLANTQVLLGTTVIPSHLISSTSITANVPDSVLAQPWAGRVMLRTPPPGGGDSNELSFAVLAAPLLANLTPSAVMAGNSDFTLTASGDMFTTQSVLRFNGVDRPTTFVNSGTLTATIRSSDVSEPNADIAVTVYEPLVQGTTPVLTFKVLPPPDTPAGAQAITRISVDSSGAEADGASQSPSISDTGRYVVFQSAAGNLVSDDTNGLPDIFLRDTCVGATNCTQSVARVSFFADGSQLTLPQSSGANSPVISGNGRSVAYSRTLSTVTPQRNDVSIYDTCIGTTYCDPTTMVVWPSDGQSPNGNSYAGALSTSGRFLAFTSMAKNLIPGDPAQHEGVYLFDTCIGAPAGCAISITRVSQTTAGDEMNGDSHSPSMSGDARYIAFTSKATNVDGGSAIDAIYLRDTCIGTSQGTCSPSTVRISMESGLPIPNVCGFVALSRNAKLFAFACADTVPGQQPVYYAHVGRTCIGTTSGCAVGDNGEIQTNTDQRFLNALPTGITDNGYVVFSAHIEGLPDISEVFVHRTCVMGTPGCQTTTVRVSVPQTGLYTQTGSWTGVISADASTIVFTSPASDFVPNDTNNTSDIFLAPLMNPLPVP